MERRDKLNKPAELQNRTGGNSSAGSEGSTQNNLGNATGVHCAEEPSNKNITQGEDEITPYISEADADHKFGQNSGVESQGFRSYPFRGECSQKKNKFPQGFKLPKKIWKAKDFLQPPKKFFRSV